ncbi:MAG TPA: hypothetical protein VFQ86_05480 [Arachidicoccus soli]|nr:hypothetical protein [Arachidicoccus soli]
MINIKKYAFVDCLLIGFSVDKTLSTLVLIIEAYYPNLDNHARNKGLLKVIFNNIKQINIEKKNDFDFDISLPYDKNGSDMKANEIYSIEVLKIENGFLKGIIHSDMLSLELQAERLELKEIEDIY